MAVTFGTLCVYGKLVFNSCILYETGSIGSLSYLRQQTGGLRKAEKDFALVRINASRVIAINATLAVMVVLIIIAVCIG